MTADLFGNAPYCLSSTDWRQWPVHSSWHAVVSSFFTQDVGQRLLALLQQDLVVGQHVYPPQPLRSLLLTPLDAVRVLVVGQDPYHQAGQANGLAFSVSPGIKVPPSLRNMYKELHADGHAAPATPRLGGSLDDWAEQGVMLLNTCLTVRDSEPASHASWGWEVLTDRIIVEVAQRSSPCVFVLWGVHAQSKQVLIHAQQGLNQPRSQAMVLTSNHPSPLSASRGPSPFLGSRVFSRINEALASTKTQPIKW